ncbi:MAG TPA: hypothetical protein DCQ04_13695 [Actinobacteria bacterium]|nr:hypothetical protein [Actinomycetota bacterium]
MTAERGHVAAARPRRAVDLRQRFGEKGKRVLVLEPSQPGLVLAGPRERQQRDQGQARRSKAIRARMLATLHLRCK